MEVRKGFGPLAARSVLISLIGLIISSFGSSTIADQQMASLIIPLATWEEGYNAADDVAYGVAVDFQDNAVIVGTSGVVKYDRNGRKLWQVDYGGIAYGVATDSLGDILIAGQAGLAKYSSEGLELWRVPGEFHHVAVAGDDRVIAVGTEGVVLYSPSGEWLGELGYPGRATGVAARGDKAVVIGTAGIAKYDLATASVIWQEDYRGELQDVAIDSEGNVLVVGSNGLAKYGPAGGRVWSQLFLGEAQGVATFPMERSLGAELFPPGDNIVVTGAHRSDGDWDYRTVKYSAQGKEIWDARYDGEQGDDISYDVAVSSDGHIYVTGTSLLAKEAAGAEGAPPAQVDQDYYTIRYVEKPLPEVLEASGRDEQPQEVVCPPETLPIVEFSVSTTNPMTDEPVYFTNNSRDPDGYLIAWSWDFGDGTTSAEWEPEHRYSRKGRYTVTLTVVDDRLCPASATAEILIGNRPPEADFWWEPPEPTDLEEALFTPEFEDPDGEVVYARWEFGDGTIVEWDSEWELGPPGRRSQIAHQYPDNGVYPVSLVVRDNDGAEAEVEKEIEVLNVPPVAGFDWEAAVEFRADFEWEIERETHGNYLDFNPQQWSPGDKPTDLDTIKFIDRSVLSSEVEFSSSAVDLDGEIVSYLWDFGDGTTSDEPNPSHQYEEPGTYDVTLTVTDDDGDTATFTRTIEVEVGGEIVEWEWDMGGAPGEFDDGTSASSQNPHFWFSDDGTYEVTLTVRDTSGNTASVTKEIEVLNIPPQMAFSPEPGHGIGVYADWFFSVHEETHGSYPSGFNPTGPTDLDTIEFFSYVSWWEVWFRRLIWVSIRARDPDGEITSWHWEFDGKESDEEPYCEGEYCGKMLEWDEEWIVIDDDSEPPYTVEGPRVTLTIAVTDDDGAEAEWEEETTLIGIEDITWEWSMGGPGEFERSTDEHSLNSFYWYYDDGEYEASFNLFVHLTNGEVVESDHTKTITILNVPPLVEFTWEVQPGVGELEADFTWEVDPEQHGTYPEGFEPEGPTDLDDILFEDLSTSGGGPPVVIFTAEGLDQDGTIVSYEWDFDSDGLIDAEGETVEWTFPEAGIYPVRVIATDDDGDSTTYEQDIKVEAVAGEIARWEWQFGDGDLSGEQHPTHWYQDDGVYEITLTVWDEADNSDSITKEISIQNVPPVADFDWSFEVPEWFLPTCDELIEGEPVAAGLAGAALALSLTPEEWGGGTACQEPEMPPDAGVVAFEDLSIDSEPWLEVDEWEWDFGGFGFCWEGEGCETDPEPRYLYFTEDLELLYRGDVDVTLLVWDDDGEGGEDYSCSNTTQTVTIANIPPYAAYEWEDYGGWAELSCSGCETAYGSGDPTNQASNDDITVTRTIYSWDCGFGEEPSAILSPWGAAGVELTIEGSGTVEVTETLPDGWSYWLGWPEECVTITEEGEDYWSASVDLDSCFQPGYVSIWYDLYPPDEGPVGNYTISGIFSGLQLDSGVVLCANVNVEDTIYFYGYGWDELWLADPNGDELVSYEWDFGEFGAASGQEPSGDLCDWGDCYFTFENLTCEYDGFDWVWSYDLGVALEVTDEAGGATTVEEVVPLSGSCMGWVPE